MGINFERLFEMQLELDAEIEQKHPTLPGEDRLAKRILALQVELGECANEWRGFKFWSSDQKPNSLKLDDDTLSWYDKKGKPYSKYRDFLLEEYVDCLHFVLSIGNAINFTAYHLIGAYEKPTTTTEMFLMANEEIVMVSRAYRESAAEESMRLYYSLLFDAFIALGEMLGFTWQQIETAYIRKNEINHQRQESGY